MKTQERPTSFPAPRGVIISSSPSLVVDEVLFKQEAGCPVEAIAIHFKIRIQVWRFLNQVILH